MYLLLMVCMCVCLKVEPGITPRDFHELVSPVMEEDITLFPARRTVSEKEHVLVSEKEHVLVGLHTCGELASTMLHIFAGCCWLVGLVSVGCCYMKPPLPPNCDSKTRDGSQHERVRTKFSAPPQLMLRNPSSTKADSEEQGESKDIATTPGRACPKGLLSLPPKHTSYPLSRFVQSLPGHELSYTAKELACHAMEVYLQKLTGAEDVCITCEGGNSNVNVLHTGRGGGFFSHQIVPKN